MQNLLTGKNLLIAGAVFVLFVGIVIFLGLGGNETAEESGGAFGGLFPSFGESGGFDGQNGTGGGLNGGADIGLNGSGTESSIKEVPASEIITELPLGSEESAGLPKGSLTLLSAERISSFTVAVSSTIYHKNIPENLGHVFERNINGTGEEKRISNLTIPQIIKVSWSPDGKKAIVFYGAEGKVRKIMLDYSAGGATPETEFLPDTISDAIFSPDSRKIAFINNLSGTNNIFIATAEFKNAKKLLDNNVPTFEIFWPADDFIALKTKSSYALPGYLYTVNINTGVMRKVAEGRGLDAVWSSDGKAVLYSSTDNYGALRNLKIYNLNSRETTEFNVKTIAEKCAFDGKDKAYCGAPKLLAPAKYPDEWWQGKVSMEDHIVELDLTSGISSVVVSTFSEVVLPHLASDLQYLLFKDKKTGYLWSLKLR